MSAEYPTLNTLIAGSFSKIFDFATNVVKCPTYDKHLDTMKSIVSALAFKKTPMQVSGFLDITDDGFGFLRLDHGVTIYDVYVDARSIRYNGLRPGDFVEGVLRKNEKNHKYLTLASISRVNHHEVHPTALKQRSIFAKLTPTHPNKPFILDMEHEVQSKRLLLRSMELMTPVGFGQRGLIVAPPRTGKTVLLQYVAQAIRKNHPSVVMMILLIDERPEEVTEMMESVDAEVVSSTFDEPASRHVHVAEMVVHRAKRLVEQKKDVVILMDSITRLARAYNTFLPASGKVLTGGVDAYALHRPKRLFGAARNLKEGGSLTILSTALVETGSRMDDVIFEEFKGTGNLDLFLSRSMADKRIFPSIDIEKSGTRKEELLRNNADLQKIHLLRRVLSSMKSLESLDFLLNKIKNTKNNEDFFSLLNQ